MVCETQTMASEKQIRLVQGSVKLGSGSRNHIVNTEMKSFAESNKYSSAEE